MSTTLTAAALRPCPGHPGRYESRARETAVGPRTGANWSGTVERVVLRKGRTWRGWVSVLGRFDHEAFDATFSSKAAAESAVLGFEVTADMIEAAN